MATKATELGQFGKLISVDSDSVNITGSLIASGITYPTADGTSNQVITTDGSGNLSFTSVDPEGTAVALAIALG